MSYFLFVWDLNKSCGNSTKVLCRLHPVSPCADFLRNHSCAWSLSHPWLCVPMDCRPPGFSVHEESPGKNTGVGCRLLFQGIFPTQGLNPGLPRCRQILYRLSLQGSPRILEWAAYAFSEGFSWPRNRTWASCIAGGFFASWATREAQEITQHLMKIRMEHPCNIID